MMFVVAAVLGLSASASARGQHHGSHKVCSGSGKHKSCHKESDFQGHGGVTLRTDPLPVPSGNVWIYAENFNEEVRGNIYKADGTFDESVLAQLDHLFRCKRTNEERAVDPRVYEMLSRIQDHYDGRRATLISGFRFAERDSSRHYHASAMDIRIPGVSIYEMYRYAESLDAGGMGLGIYPTSGFIHFDYRAPGEPSYRWTDYSGHGGGHKKPGNRTQPARKPTS